MSESKKYSIFQQKQSVPTTEELFAYIKNQANTNDSQNKESKKADKKIQPSAKRTNKKKESLDENLDESIAPIFEMKMSQNAFFESPIQQQNSDWQFEQKIQSNILYREAMDGFEQTNETSLFHFEELNAKINEVAYRKQNKFSTVRIASLFLVTMLLGSVSYFLYTASLPNTAMQDLGMKQESTKQETDNLNNKNTIDISLLPIADSVSPKDIKISNKKRTLPTENVTAINDLTNVQANDTLLSYSNPVLDNTEKMESTELLPKVDSKEEKIKTENTINQIPSNENELIRRKDATEEIELEEKGTAKKRSKSISVEQKKERTTTKNAPVNRRSVYSGDGYSEDMVDNYSSAEQLYARGNFDEAATKLLSTKTWDDKTKVLMAKIEFARKNYALSNTYIEHIDKSSTYFYDAVYYKYLNYGMLNDSVNSQKYRKILSNPDSPYRERFAPR